MAMSVTARPDSVNGVVKSDWVASKNPILYKIRRQDQAFASINDVGGFYEFVFTGIDLTTYFEAGNSVFYRKSDAEAGTGLVVSSTFGGGDTEVLTDIAVIGGTLAGFLNNLSKRTDWKVFIEVFRSSNDTSLNSIQFSYSPSPSTWVATCDISAILKSYVKAEWSLPAGVNEAEADTNLKFYIKYQEYYDGALIGSPSSDLLSPRYVVHAAMQIFYMGTTYAHGGNLLSYVPADSGRNWMTRFWVSSVLQKVRMWRGWPFTLSFIWDTSITKIATLIQEYKADDTTVGALLFDVLSDVPGFLNRLKIAPQEATAKYLKVSLHGYTTQAESDSVTGGAITTVDFELGQTYPAGDYRFFLEMVAEKTGGSDFGGAGSGTVSVRNSSGGAMQTLITSFIGGSPTNYTNGQDITTVETITQPFDQIRFVFNPGAASDYDYGFSAGLLVPMTAELTVHIEEPCDNTVYLFWKNSTGGDSFYMFQFNQEHGYNFSGSKKATRKVLFAEHLELVEWEAINELNDLSEVYKNNITELSSAVVKTHSKVNGNQVYAVDASGNKIGVTVIPTANRTDTRLSSHKIELEIEYPETFQ